MAIRVKEIRLSLIWKKVFYKDSNLPLLADRERYQAAFEKAGSAGAEGPWLLPWFGDHRQHFWEYYLQPVAPANFRSISAADARSYFVPLRIPPCVKKIIARDGTIATLEGFCFPHSVAVLATVYVRPPKPLPLADMVDAAITARNADFQLTWKDGQPATHGQLQSLADKIVERIHAVALADPSATGKALPFPITVATVIDAEVIPEPVQATATAPPTTALNPGTTQAASAPGSAAPTAVISDGEMLARALTALCNMDSGWRSKGPSDPKEELDPEKRDGHGLMIERGRAFWLRKHFSDVETKGRKTAIACYHRNISLATMQTAALAAVVTRASEVLGAPKGELLLMQRADVVQAIKLLNLLRGNTFSTYQSWVVQKHVGFYADRIEQLTQQLG